MACTMHLAWDDRLACYDFGPGHPMAPVRVELTMELARGLGMLDTTGVTVAVPNPANTAELERVHDGGYVSAVRRASEAEPASLDPATLFQYGLGTEDDPIFPGMHDAAALVAGRPIDPQTPTPQAWRDYAQRRTGQPAPELMTDGHPAMFPPFESGYDPAEPVDRTIMATRNAVFPLNGLMPFH
jgi:Histone deacetylase domain